MRGRGESQCESASGRERIWRFLLPSGLGTSVSARSTAFATSGRERISAILLPFGPGAENVSLSERGSGKLFKTSSMRCGSQGVVEGMDSRRAILKMGWSES